MTLDEIRSRIKELGLTVRELARRAGIDENYLSKSLAVPKPGSKTKPRKISVEEMGAIERILAPISQDVAPLGSVPIIGQVAAGNWHNAVQRPIGSMPKPDPSVPPQAFALRVMGDSMDLLVEDGGTVIIDPQDKDLFQGRYYVIINGDGETTFKQFRTDPARLVPCSSNPEHTDIPINAQFEVVGRVIWRASRM